MFTRASPSSSAFPYYMTSRFLHCRFRGLPSVRLRYGLHARQVAIATLYTEGFSGFVTSTAALTLQDSRPHVLFGTVLVKHLLDLISSFPQPVQFLRFDFGDGHRGRAIRIQSGGNQRVCNFQDVLKLFFKRPPSFCIHWRFSLSPIVDSDQLRLSFFHCSAPILCRRSLCAPRYRTIRSPAVLPGSIGWSTATTSYAFRRFGPCDTLLPKFPSLGLQLRDVSLQTVVGWKPDRVLHT
jgi:hypothetical protein